MRVCLVCPYDLSVPGGVGKHALALAERLRALGDDAEVIGPASERGALPPYVTGFAGVASIHGNESDNRIGILTSPWAVRRYMRRRSFDVLHVHEPLLPALAYYALWSAAARARVCTFHCYSEDESTVTRIGRKLASSLLRRFDRGLAVSEPAARHARIVWRRSLSVVPNGVDTRFFAAPVRAIERAEPLRLLFVGQWMDRRKGLSVLLAACEHLRAQSVEFRLDVVGRGDTSTERASPIPGVVFHGTVSEEVLRQHLLASAVFVSPALGCESFGMLLLEAMAAGRPVLCSDIEGYRQLGSSAGVHLVPPGNAAALADAIARLGRAPDLRELMGRQNAIHAREYDWTPIALRVRQEYELALGATVDSQGTRLTASLASAP